MKLVGLRTKLIFPVLLGAFLLTLSLKFVLEPAWKLHAKETETLQQRKVISAMTPDLIRNILANDYASLFSTLNLQMQQNENYWLSLFLTLPNGEQIYPAQESTPTPKKTDLLITIERQLAIGNEPIANLKLSVDWSANWLVRKREITQLEILVMLIIGAATVALILMQEMLVRRPIIHLESAAGRIADGDFSIQLPATHNRDEIGQLSHSFQLMTAKLKESQKMFLDALTRATEDSIRFKTIHDALADALMVIDERGVILSFNPAAESMFGYSDREAIGANINMLIPPDLRHGHSMKLKSFYGSAQEKLDLSRQVFAFKKDRTVFPIIISISKMALSGHTYFTALIRDVTKEKAFEAELQQSRKDALAASQAKSEFLAKMSHEIRTPLNGVIGMAQLLNKSPLSEKQHKQLTTILQSGQSLLTIINDILDLSKIESGSMVLENIEFSLLKIVQDVMDLFYAKCQEKGIKLTADYAKELPNYFIGDPTRIKQILLNLLSNSVKFTQEGEISLTVKGSFSENDSFCSLSIVVQDTGIGISDEAKMRLFESFVQADDSTTRKYGGTGLGLAITKQLTELMKGSISVESQVAQGSTFKVQLPIHLSDQLHNQEELTLSPPSLHGDQFTGHILLVEDVEMNQIVVEGMLEDCGLTISCAFNGIDAIQMVAENDYDLILMDCQMPQMDGFDATKIIRNDMKKTMPIIALTADAYDENKIRCEQAGMNDFITKPLSEDALIETLKRWLPVAPTDAPLKGNNPFL